MDGLLLEWFSEKAAYFQVIEADGRMAGFLIAVAHDSGYESQYFQWFRDRYERFLYIDRVIVAPWAKRRRLAWLMVEKVDQFAREKDIPLVSDVYSHPPNEPSLAFHRKFGFEQVGVQRVAGGTKKVAKFLKMS
jgi:predicted GNAT superfamily acetyltransferase